MNGKDEQADALAVAGDQLDDFSAERFELVKMLGRHEAFGMVAGKTTAAWAECLARLKDTKAYKAFNLTWDEFCPRFLNISRDTADRVIRDHREFGAVYFQLQAVARISREKFRMISGQFTDSGELEIGGEVVAITKNNGDKIREYIEDMHHEVERTKEEASRLKRVSEKAKEAQMLAEEKAKRAEQALHANETTKKNWWAGADEDHRFLLDLEQEFDFLLTRIRTFGRRELSADNQERYLAFCQQIWAETHQVTYAASQQYGKGLLMPLQSELAATDSMTPNKRSLVAEFRKKNPLK